MAYLLPNPPSSYTKAISMRFGEKRLNMAMERLLLEENPVLTF